MKLNKYILISLTIMSLVACNARVNGNIVDQNQQNLESDTDTLISNVSIEEGSSNYTLTLKYVDSENMFREERALIPIVENAYAYNVTMNFTSLNKRFSGVFNCRNTDCSNIDLDVNFTNSETGVVSIAQRKFTIDSSVVEFSPKGYQTSGDVLFEAKSAKSNSASTHLEMKLITIEGIEMPLVDIQSNQIEDDSYTIKSKGVNSSISLAVNKSSVGINPGEFDVKEYRADGYGKFYLVMSNYSGDIIIDSN